MPTRLSALAVTLLVAFASATAQSRTASPVTREWIQLFNGRNLDGWQIKFAGSPLGANLHDTFRVDSGLMMVRYDKWPGFHGEFGHIFYKEPFSYYLVAAEYRFVGNQVKGAGPDLGWAVRNNGIMVHSQSAESMGLDQDFPMSLEVQLLGGTGNGPRSTANLCTPGTDVHFGDSLVTEHCINSTSKTYDGDQWVRVEALVLGDSIIKHIANGDTVLVYRKPQMGGGFANHMKPGVKVDGTPLTSGYIALQAETAPIDFRKVELLNLSGCMDPKASNYKSYYVHSDPASCRRDGQPRIESRSAPILEQNGYRFRDLNRNGALDPYEDWRLTPMARARDLVARMTLDEKAGAMMHGTARAGGALGGAGVGTTYDTAATRVLIDSAKVTSMITRLRGEPAALAEQHNALQAIAERTRLGIPLTISTDPRNHFQYVIGASVAPGQFSQWPEPLGFAAIDDTALTRRFADIARQEYRAVGIHMALSPQADLATEPRWSRIDGTFGEDAHLAERHVRAYVEGFQHGDNGVDSLGVVTVVKHWVGYGAAKDGWDSHNYYGRFASFSDDNLDYHIRPFLGAFAVKVGGVMPTYSILQGATWKGAPIEQVGAGFNRQLLTDLLRNTFSFNGIVLTDWAITNNCGQRCQEGVPAGQRPTFADVGMPWGVEQLPMRARFVKAVQAGVDQFGGTERSDLIVAAARANELSETRVDSSVQRIMAQKFALGLFEDPFVDTAAANRIVGSESFRAAGLDAQRRALVLLRNRGKILPLSNRRDRAKRVFVHGIARDAIEREGWTVVDDPARADVAIFRLVAPSERLHPQYVFGAMQHEGSLAFRDGDADYELFKRVSAKVPTIVTVYADRPAILTPIRDRARALLVNFGVSDAALLDVLTGRAKPEGTLPFELPSSASAVARQKSDVPHDSPNPLYRIGFGLRY